MKLSHPVFIGILFQVFSISQIHAQLLPDSVFYRESVSSLHRIYLNDIGDNAQIYHGTEYIRNGQKAVGFPFYESDSMLKGSVSYQGNIFTDLDLRYDLVSDELITGNYSHNALIALAPAKVDSFTIGTHEFLQLRSGLSNGLNKDGYYEQLFSGEPGMYARREKRLVSGTGNEEAKYILYNYYFIKMKNAYYAVDGKNPLLDLFKDEEDVLKKFIRTNKLNFKKNPESSLLLTTIYYSQLKH